MRHTTRLSSTFRVWLLCGLAAAVTAAQPVQAQSLKPVRLATASGIASPITANILIGKFLGYYKQEGLDFDLATLGARGSVAVVNALASGTAQFGAGGPDTIFRAEKQGVEAYLVGVYCYTPGEPQKVAVLADSPIKSIADLKGKKVGIRGAGFKSYTEGILRAADMPVNSVEYLPVGIGSAPFIALKKGEVDALSLFDVNMKRVETLGANLRYLDLPAQWGKLQGPILYGRKEVFDKNPQMVIGFGRAVAKGTLFTITNPEAAVRIFYDMYPQAVPKGRSFAEAVKNTTEVLEARVPQLRLRHSQNGQWGYMDPEAWSLEAKLFGHGHNLKRPVDAYFMNKYIGEVNKFDQQAIVNQAKSFNLETFKANLKR